MANQHNRMILAGSLPGGEVWSVGCAYKREDVITDNVIRDYEALLDQANEVWDIIAAWPTSHPLRRLLSTGGSIQTVRWEYLDGQTLEQAAEVSRTPVVGDGNMTKVFQTSLVFSLLSGRPGRSYRGRMYWPGLGAAISFSTGRLSTPTAQQAADAMSVFLKDAGRRGGGQPDVDPVIYSPKLDIVTPVTQVEVGDVLDTQRRRRDALVEARFTSDIPS